MLPLKWKIFRGICYLHMAAVISIITLNIIFTWRWILSDTDFLMNFVIGLSVFTVLLSNTIINVVLLDRYYPDRRPGGALNAWHIILLILFIIIIVLLTIGSFTIYYEAFSDENYTRKMDNRMMVLMMLIGVIVLTGLSICYFQVSLRKTIRRNADRTFDSFLEADTP